MRVGANDIDGVPAGSAAGSLMGSSASLTEESLRRRPSHSRKASVESLDLEEDSVLPQLMQGMHLAGARPGRYTPPRRGSDEHLTAPTPEASVASHAAPGSSSAAPRAAVGVVADDTDDEGEELTSTEKPPRPDAPDALSPTPSPSRPPPHPGPATIVADPAARAGRIRAVVAVGGYLVDRAGGAPGEKEYKGGDTSIVAIPRGCTFRDLAVLIDVEPEEDHEDVEPPATATATGSAGATGAAGASTRDPILLAARRLRIQYKDPADPSTLIRVKNDNDVTEMFEEWEAAVAAGTATGKLRVYVVEIATAAGRSRRRGSDGSGNSSPSTIPSRGGVGSDEDPRSGEGAGAGAANAAASGRGAHADAATAAAAKLQVIPSAELELVNRLGGGAFGEVHLALWRGSEVAVKFLNHVNAMVQDAAAEMEDEDTDTDEEEAAAAAAASGGERAKDDSAARGGGAVGVRRDRDRDRGAMVAARNRNLEMESFLREARTMASLQHPNVVFIYGVVDDGDRLGIVEEFMSSGSLRRLLNMHARDAERRRERARAASVGNEGAGTGTGTVGGGGGDDSDPNTPRAAAAAAAAANAGNVNAAAAKSLKNMLSARARARCALDVARGMAYLHSKRFVHFDLKCDNVLTARRGARLTCKVCDFGLSKQRGSRATFVSGITSHRGTLPWTAPELLSDPSRASERVDVYSFAIAMWELWTGRYPYADMREQTIMYGIMTGMRPDLPGPARREGVDADGDAGAGAGAGADAAPDPEPEPCPGWRELMTSAWAENPSARPTFDEIATRLEAMIKAAEKADAPTGGANELARGGG
jgi:serine/threonine protein kinase